MIIDKFVKTKVTYRTHEKWKSLGYPVGDFSALTKQGLEILVDPNHLDSKSNVMVKCVCDSCGNHYSTRYSRNTDICAKCRPKNNNNGRTGQGKPIPHCFIENSHLKKTELCRKYDVSLPVINRWLSETNIVKPHFEGNYLLSPIERAELVDYITNIPEQDRSPNTIAEVWQVPGHYVRQIMRKNDIPYNNWFVARKREYEHILDNMDKYVQLNQKQTLKQISEDHNLSIEQLKKAFRETNTDVVLHSHYRSQGELEVKQFIIDSGFSCVTIRKDRKEIDCFVPSHLFGIEYCGEYWHSEDKNRHKVKRDFYAEHGITLMTVFESEWQNKPDIIKSMILSRLGKSDRIFARNTSVIEISSNEARIFHEQNHINGYVNSSVNVALIKDNQIVSVLSFVKSRFTKHEWEISRFSTRLGFVVVGGLSKMMTYFKRTYDPKSIMTYADLRFGEGKSYEKIGMVYTGTTPPNYYYFKKDNVVLESRHKYQKSKLKHMKSYDPNKTEFEIMKEEGYYKIWDCGNARYEMGGK